MASIQDKRSEDVDSLLLQQQQHPETIPILQASPLLPSSTTTSQHADYQSTAASSHLSITATAVLAAETEDEDPRTSRNVRTSSSSSSSRLMTSSSSTTTSSSARISINNSTTTTTTTTTSSSSTVQSPEPQIVTFDDPTNEEDIPFLTANQRRYQEYNDNEANDKNKKNEGMFPSCGAFRDWPCMVLFVIQMIVIFVIGVVPGRQGWKHVDMIDDWKVVIGDQVKQADDVTPEDFEAFLTLLTAVTEWVQIYPARITLYILLPVCYLACLLCLWVMVYIVKPYADLCVKATLYVAIMTAVLIMAVNFLTSPGPMSLLAAILVIGGVWSFVNRVWKLIPFAAVNLKVALIGIHANAGLYFWALCFSELCFWWFVFWLYSTVGLMLYRTLDWEPEEDSPSQALNYTSNSAGRFLVNAQVLIDTGENDDNGGFAIALFLLVSLFWTTKVMKNTVHVTVAGVMATWCFDQRTASGCCSNAIWNSLYRSLTHSFGSICFGSFFQGMACTLRSIINDAKRNNRHSTSGGGGGGGRSSCCCGVCLCVVEFAAKVFGDVLDYFNQWAYIFVGIYGHPYLESGKKATELFQSKGWMPIVTERLLNYVLGALAVSIGALSGVLAILLAQFVDSAYNSGLESEMNYSFIYGPIATPYGISFVTGFLPGFVVASIMLSVIKGAINTLIVCWADSPLLLETNHPELIKEMVDAWSFSFPEATLHTTAQATPVLNHP